MLFIYMILAGTIIYLFARLASVKNENDNLTLRIQIIEEYLKYSKYKLNKEYYELKFYNLEDISSFSDLEKTEHYMRLGILESLLKNDNKKKF